MSGTLYKVTTKLKTLKDRLQWAMDAHEPKVTQADLHRVAGVSRSAVSDWLSGATKTMEGSNLTKVADALGVSAHWLATGDGEPRARKGASIGMTPILTWDHEDDLPPGEYAFIARLDVHLSAGGGKDQLEIQFIQEPQPNAFRTDWIRKKRLKPAKLAVMYVSGDSMAPFINDGDAVVVDTSQRDVVDGKVFALWYDGGERVKRLYRHPAGGLVVHSDNERNHPEMTLTPRDASHVRILGRVVHRSGDGGL